MPASENTGVRILEDSPGATVTMKQTAPDVLVITLQPPNDNEDFDQIFLLRSDAHHDHAQCDQELERRHLDEAKAKHAGIFDGGDLFCAMQGKWDKRKDRSAMRPEYADPAREYLDALASEAVDFYEPYSKNMLLLAPGNHESSITRNHETNLTQRLADRLNERTGSNIRVGSYAGWILFRCWYKNKLYKTFNLYRHHGYGGGGPVTRGVIQTNRMAVYLPDADVVWSGHTHDEWIVPIKRARISTKGVPYQDRQTHIKTPGYKDEFSGGKGWWIETGKTPRPKGSCWLRVWYDKSKRTQESIIPAFRIRLEMTDDD